MPLMRAKLINYFEPRFQRSIETSNFQNVLLGTNHGGATQASQNQVKTLSWKNSGKSNLTPPEAKS
jgi:hypothetical protein